MDIDERVMESVNEDRMRRDLPDKVLAVLTVTNATEYCGCGGEFGENCMDLVPYVWFHGYDPGPE